MSVQMIENWSQIEGTVQEIRPETELEGFSAVEIMVQEVRPVEGFAHLLEGVEGSELEVIFPDELISTLGIEPDVHIAVRARRAGLERVFAHREHVRVEGEGGSR